MAFAGRVGVELKLDDASPGLPVPRGSKIWCFSYRKRLFYGDLMRFNEIFHGFSWDIPSGNLSYSVCDLENSLCCFSIAMFVYQRGVWSGNMWFFWHMEIFLGKKQRCISLETNGISVEVDGQRWNCALLIMLRPSSLFVVPVSISAFLIFNFFLKNPWYAKYGFVILPNLILGSCSDGHFCWF